MEIQQITGGIDFEREIKAAMRIGRVFQGQHHWVQSEAHLLRVQNLTEQLVIVHNRRCQLNYLKAI
ncbi:hypothetical protein [Peribacillus frigoritolerans]|uniref:hypothetical protein n=2 Tax=Peribacillus TaxID=2675229 RepID=UPI00227E993B|nr:hypothetical protein [Peribacillus frigoritolerans]MCY9140858.1 hypothetical protein [Peribacillus frigoritolerans]MED4689938.1 hypothetical protein [Peribacillus frigoritolerans]WHY15012.1 hypothetical protein QNH16_04915 [Peribacillus frigoritolerans]